MDFDATIDIIIKDLKEIGGIVDDLKSYPGVPPFQAELVKSKIRYAEEVMNLLKTTLHEKKEPFVNEEQPEKHPAAKRKTGDITSSVKPVPVKDIASAIRTNERFLFIREIFNGNASAYEEAIDKIDRAGSLSDAKAVIMSYTGESKESEAVSQLMEIVKRKFPSNG